MIEITVKTLDSQNHSFSVADDTTVKQFKEKIFEKLPFPVDSQRLIYCGRVLQDDKKLTEYDVNGKVIHLVQRPPPQTSTPSPSSGASGRTNGNGSRPSAASRDRRFPGQSQIFRSRLDGGTGNAMYLGAMAIPADVMDASGITMPQPSHALSQSRLSVARRMIRSASATLTLLENAENGTPETPPTEPETPPAEPGTPPEVVTQSTETASDSSARPESSREVGIILVTNENDPVENSTGEPFLQPSTAAVIASAFSAARSSGIASHMTISRQAPGAEAVSLSVDMDAQGNITRVNGDNFRAASSSSGESASPPQEASDETGAEPAAATAGATPLQRRPSRQGYARPPALAGLLDELNRVNQRLQPFYERYHQLLHNDPSFEGDEAGSQAAHRMFMHVSEVMHCLSHAYHAISDIMCDYTQAPPRALRCRPVLIQHSAVLQAGIPVGAFSMLSNRTAAAAGQPQPTEGPVATSEETSVPPDTSLPTPPPPPPPQEAQDNSQHHQHHHQPRVRILRSNANARGATTMSGMTPNNVEFIMEVAPGSITIDSVEATLMSGNTGLPLGSLGLGSIDASVLGEGGFPWGSPAPPEFIQNLMQAVAGHMINRSNEAATGAATTPNPATTTSTTTGASDSTTSSGAPTAANVPGQTSQARGNTATHPTTSTQTRSTSRPHVHLQQSMGSFGSNAFDPFLPCNSHHVVRPSRRARRPGPRSQTRPEEVHGFNMPFHASGPLLQTGGDEDDLLSNLINGIVEGYSRDGVPVETPATSSETANLSGARPPVATDPHLSPLYNLFNILGGEGVPTNVDGGASTTSVPLIQQILQGLGGAILGRTAGSTLADILRSMPDHSFREGESLFTDFIMTMARNLTLHDTLAMSMGRVESLNRLLPHLQDFVIRRVLENEPPTLENIGIGAERLTSELRPFLDILLESRLREEIDVILTVNNYNEIRMAELIQVITAQTSPTVFGQWLTRWFRLYLRELFAILSHCCVDGMTGLESILMRYLNELTSSMPVALQEWTVRSSLTDLRAYMQTLNISEDQVRSYIILRSSEEPAVAPEVSLASTTRTEVHAQVVLEETVVDEPMETDIPLTATDALLVAEGSLPTLVSVPDTVPVIIPEAWHNALPSDWVPIIARDSQRQRRQNPQPPFSDAYLADMPSKRRKVVTSAKPQGSLNQVIADSVRTAVGVAGAAPNVPNMETVAETVGTDPNIQAAYREQVRASVGDNLTNNLDFLPEKYPNTAKYFKKK